MEVVGSIASVIAIGQALAAVPKIAAAIRSVSETSSELAMLLKEIESLRVTCQQTQDLVRLFTGHLPDELVAMLEGLEREIRDTVSELERFSSKCTASSRSQQHKEAAKAKPKALRWLWMRSQLPQLYHRTRNTRDSLQMVLQMAQSHFLHRMLNEGLKQAVQSAVMSLAGLQDSASPMSDFSPAGSAVTALRKKGPKMSRQSLETDKEQALPASIDARDSGDPGFIAPESEDLAQDSRPPVAPVGSCSASCACRCHSAGTQTSVWGKSSIGLDLGTLRVSYTAQSARCSIPSCTRKSSSPIELQYRFPTWLYAGILSLSASSSSLTGPGSTIHFTHGRVYPMRSWVRWYAASGQPDHFKPERNNNELYYPSDMLDGEVCLLEPAIMNFNFPVVEFLLRYWAPILRHTGVDKRTAVVAANFLKLLDPVRDASGIKTLREVVSLYPLASSLARTPEIHAAIKDKNDKLLVALLQEDQSSKDSLDPRGSTPLHVAAGSDNPEAIRTLLAAGADPNSRDHVFGEAPLQVALRLAHFRCAKELIGPGTMPAAGHSIISDDALGIILGGREPDRQTLSEVLFPLLIRKLSLAHHRDSLRRTPLHLLAANRWESDTLLADAARMLLDAGAVVEARNDDGEVPVTVALRHGKLSVASVLLDSGARIESVGAPRRGVNLLHQAAFYWTTETIQFVEARAGDALDVDVEKLSVTDRTPWDNFIWALVADPVPRLDVREPDQANIAAFVHLFTACRDRALQHDVSVLARVLEALERSQASESRALLEPLVRLKKSQNRHAEVRTFHAIEIQIREGMWEAARESVGERMDVLKEELVTSPWVSRTPQKHRLYLKYSKQELIALRGGIELQNDDDWYTWVERQQSCA